MKKILFLLLFALVANVGFAQIGYGVEVGVGLSGAVAANADYTAKFSPRIGAFINYDKMFSSGIYYTRKGSKLMGFIPDYARNIQGINYSTNYLEIVPVSLLLLETQLSSKISVGINLGLYAAYGFGGKATLSCTAENQSLVSYEIDNLYKDEDFNIAGTGYQYNAFKAFDYGFRLGVNVGISKQFRIKLEESFGVPKLSFYDKRLYDFAAHLSVCYIIK